jgi:protein tyrosine phosphatase (PTP) superfamily phosphohydrolase (DUF442 family)
VETQVLHNVFKMDAALFSGNAPEDEAGFRELARLGVKTIISVDGSKPNLVLAHQFGMRYVHLPFGYDGLPQDRGVELARAAQIAEAAGPVYLHCHHGIHRGPAAAATVCRALDGWSADEANDFLMQAGTSPDYAGLFRDVRAFRPPAADQLALVKADFPETSKTPPLVDTMVEIDGQSDALKAAQKAGWREVPGHPDEPPARTSVLLWELLHELARDPETKKRGEDFTAKLAEGERNADVLRAVLADPTQPEAARTAALNNMNQACVACHKAHRNHH